MTRRTCRAAIGAVSATTCSGASPTGTPLGYDNEGRLAIWANTPGSSPTQSASYLYDGTGQRVQQVATANGTTTTTTSYIGSLEEATSSGGTTTTTAHYGGLAESVNGAVSYLLADGLGSVSEAVSTSGSVSATQLYGPYGAVRYQSGTLPTSKGYTGQRADASTSGLDEYAYVGGNPKTFVDPIWHEVREGDEVAGAGGSGQRGLAVLAPLPSQARRGYTNGAARMERRRTGGHRGVRRAR